MMLLNWLNAKKPASTRKGTSPRPRKSFGQTTLPLISPRRGRRILRREQLFSVVLDANGDSFLVLIDLALPAEVMPDEYLLEIERWIQASADSRHGMTVGSVYWRRKPVHDQRGIALKAAVVAQTRRDAPASAPAPLVSDTAIPRPSVAPPSGRAQPVGRDELEAFRLALESVQTPLRGGGLDDDVFGHLPPPESHSDFGALSATQYGKL